MYSRFFPQSSSHIQFSAFSLPLILLLPRRWNVNKVEIQFVVSTSMTSESAATVERVWGKRENQFWNSTFFRTSSICQHWSWSIKNGILTMTGFMDLFFRDFCSVPSFTRTTHVLVQHRDDDIFAIRNSSDCILLSCIMRFLKFQRVYHPLNKGCIFFSPTIPLYSSNSRSHTICYNCKFKFTSKKFHAVIVIDSVYRSQAKRKKNFFYFFPILFSRFR